MSADAGREAEQPTGETPETETPKAKDDAASLEAAADAIIDAGGPREALDDTDWRAEAANLKDRLLRAMADAENARRRARKDVEDAGKYGAFRFARDLLSVGDNLKRALDAAPKDAEGPVANLIAGVAATERELVAALERHGVRRVDPIGERFDPNLHEALFEAPSPDAPAGTVTTVVETGYVMGDRLLRAAKVGISKGGGSPAPAPAPASATNEHDPFDPIPDGED